MSLSELGSGVVDIQAIKIWKFNFESVSSVGSISTNSFASPIFVLQYNVELSIKINLDPQLF